MSLFDWAMQQWWGGPALALAVMVLMLLLLRVEEPS